MIRKSGGSYLIGRIVPTRLLRAVEDIKVAREGIVAIRAGTLMIRLADDPRSACELQSRGSSAFACIRDTNSDGKYDTYFGTQVFNTFFVGSIGDDGGFEALAGPVVLTEIDAKANTPPINLFLDFGGQKSSEVKYRVCLWEGWDSKYPSRGACLRRSGVATLDSSGNALIYGKKIRFDGLKSKPKSIFVDHNPEDVPFSTGFSIF